MTSRLISPLRLPRRHMVPQGPSGDLEDFPTMHLKDFYASLPTPVTIVSAFNSESQPLGTTVGSYCTVSLEPPLALFCLLPTSELLSTLSPGKELNIHFPRPEESDIKLSKRFAGKGGAAKFEGVDWETVNRAPAITQMPNASATIDTINDVGDHAVVTVEFTTVPRPLVSPLLYRERCFGSFDPKESS